MCIRDTDIINGKDKRQLMIDGPCSIHDVSAAMEYARKLQKLQQKYSDKLFIVMRVYFEKPRTTIGWKGLINDPDIDSSYNIEKGIKTARKLLRDIALMGLPAGTEMLDTIIPQYISDLVSWTSIGARTTESQPHRVMASGLSMPVGFKNGTDGNPDIAINAMEASKHQHSFIGIDKKGKLAVVRTAGNQWGHLIHRGGKNHPNYDQASISDSSQKLENSNLNTGILVDCSHDNSGKKHDNQPKVVEDVISQIKSGKSPIIGMMVESNLFEGNQKIPKNLSELKYGTSITDACIGWETTESLLNQIYKSI